MPILITEEEFPEPPPLPEEPPPPTPTPAPPGTRAWTLTDSAGVAITLGASARREGYLLLAGMQGHGLPPVALASDALPADHGSVFRALRLTERDVFLPVAIIGADINGTTTLRRALERLVDPLRGVVTLTVSHPTGERRYVRGYYVGGAEGDGSRENSSRVHEKRGLILRCLDPWWYGEEASRSWVLVTATSYFLSATLDFFPATLAPSTVGGTAVLDVDGDVDAEPIWEITGPGDSVTVTNATTGESWDYDASIAGGDTIRVDCRRTQQTVTAVGAGTNLFANLSPNPNLWLLRPGSNTVQVSMPSATADSRVSVRWVPRYRSFG